MEVSNSQELISPRFSSSVVDYKHHLSKLNKRTALVVLYLGIVFYFSVQNTDRIDMVYNVLIHISLF
jgi:hypothetical protein